MKAALITIGDEILSGNTVDTNSTFIAEQLKNIGIKTVQIFTISDEIETIKKTLKSAFEMADLVITTGGLGPTKDDKTKIAFKDFFNDRLVLDEKTFEHLRQLLIKRKREHLLEINKDQAVVLSKAFVFQNFNGTAPCQMLEVNGKIAICLPGVPYEVKPFIRNQIVPYLQDKFQLDFIENRIISVVDYPESLLSNDIESWELSLPKHISLAYLPVGNRVKLKLTASGNDQKELQKDLEIQVKEVAAIIGERVIATHEDKIEQILHDILIKQNLTISTAESCTGGELARLITSISGSSNYFLGGIIPYQTEKKTQILGVDKNLIEKFTVVSEEVATEMAEKCQELFKTDIAISTTGVAGPNKGEDGNETGTIFYSIRIKDKTENFRLFLPHLDRGDFLNFVSQKIIQELVTLLVKNR
ncbi:nicotinamide-nucleotide amidase [Halpernia humi]|uniref:CinA-like protein n=1 Tax=Halpernia humi TaxID=493375 RepID=A0A1H6AIL5_9FLAO|nr:CinA family nicotinamide mononucleotide deamidase-related protein [Halpernia humi]SEG48232.1 nicotinamide-nucleotide amidase [Halpernia humi]